MNSRRLNLDSPILFIGTHRSGTTWMGDMLSTHPDLAYWDEPRHVWSWGHNYRRHDRLTADDATDRVKMHIRKAFENHVRRSGRSRLVEKTPSNCLRIPFLRAIYPEARIILIIRDGRSVVSSTAEIVRGPIPPWRIVKRARETPIWEWPAFAGRTASMAARIIARRPLNYWGPRPPGWQQWLRHDHPDVVRAKQWAAMISCAVADARQEPPDRFMSFKYEDLLDSPRQIMRQLVDFARLDNADELVERVASTANPARKDGWRSRLSAETLERIRPHMEPTLNALGYSW